MLQITIKLTQKHLSHIEKKFLPSNYPPRETYLLIIFRKLKHALYQVQVFLIVCFIADLDRIKILRTLTQHRRPCLKPFSQPQFILVIRCLAAGENELREDSILVFDRIVYF